MKSYRPTTPSRRHMTTVPYRGVLTASKPHKALTRGRSAAAGRASSGRITVRHKGGGAKRRLRLVDFRYKHDTPAVVETVEYDPNRSGFIGRVCYRDGERRYHVLPDGVRPGGTMLAAKDAAIAPGNRMPLSRITVGTVIYNIELHPGRGSRLVRAAGSGAVVLGHDERYTQLKLPSGEIRKVLSLAWASVGAVSNTQHNLAVYGKAGRSRWKGIRPTVRGSAMNPVDHPYGGGEGRAPQGTRRPKNRWGKGTRGVRTRKRKKYSNTLIVSRRKTKRRT